MIRITLLIVSAAFYTGTHARSLLAQPHIVVGAGTGLDRSTGQQIEFSIAAATDGSDGGTSGIMTIRQLAQEQAQQGHIESVVLVAEHIDIHFENGIPLRADILASADVKLRRRRRFRGLPARCVVSESSLSVDIVDPRGDIVHVQVHAGDFNAVARIEQFESMLLVTALGEATEVPTAFQAAAAIAEDGRAIGNLSLVAHRDNGDLVHVAGDVSRAQLRSFNRSGQRLQLQLIGTGAVDVVRPDGTSPDICAGAFSFVANEGPHGPYRLEMPDCRDPLAGIEGSDIGSGGETLTAVSWPPAHLPILTSPADDEPPSR